MSRNPRLGLEEWSTMTRRTRSLVAPVVVMLVVMLVASGCRYTANLHLPSEQAVSSRILWGDGTLLTRVHGIEDRDPVKLAEMAKILPRAVIAIEDARFYQHGGFDVRGIARALTRNLEQGRAAEGGSTITQQYVRAVLLGNQKTLKRKLHEAVMAMQIEDRYSKKTILERYLNTVYFGNGAYGVQAAARTYFGTDAAQVDLAQATLLAGLIRSPNDYDPFVRPDLAVARRNQVVDRMQKLRKISAAEATLVRALPVGVIQRSTDIRYPAPYFVEKVKKFIFNDRHFGATVADRERKLFQGGLTIETTLDPKWQQEAETSLRGVLTDPSDPPGAIVAIDPRTGYVKAYASSLDFFSVDPGYRFQDVAKLDLANARSAAGEPIRQPGSTFKPFVLAAALQQGIPLTRTYNGPAHLEIPVPGSEPFGLDNFENQGFGRLSLLEATVKSVNTVYGQLVMDVGPQKVADVANAMGITNRLDPFPTIAIGNDSVTVEDMASAYGTLASDGVHHPEIYVTRVTDRTGRVLYENHPAARTALSPTVARTVTGALQQVVQRGTGVNARIGRPVAGKTGTMDRRTDAWFVGYTPELVAAVWVGFPTPECTPDGRCQLVQMTPPRTRINVQGGEFPAKIWQIFASSALADVPASLFPVPDPPSASTSTTSTTTRPPIGPGLYSVVGRTVFSAVSELTQDGYRVEIVRKPSRRFSPGYVTEQSPAAGTGVRPGSTVTLTVATGPPREFTVPNVLGLLADQAAAEIERAGFVANVIVESEPPPGTAGNQGKAWKQSPISDDIADEATIISVWVNP